MSIPFRQAISDRRRILQNQYALLEEIEAMEDLNASRKMHECPYAHIDELDRINRPIARLDGMDVMKARKPHMSAKVWLDLEIQKAAGALHIEIWEQRKDLFENHDSMQPIDMLDPVVALKLLGYQVDIEHALGSFVEGKTSSNIAGLIDKPNMRVLLSSAYPQATRNFTAAHELGHAAMHEFVGMHRDKPLDGTSSTTTPQEREADKFAAYFLMPEKLLTRTFEGIFGQRPFVVSEETQFALSGQLPKSNKPWSPRNLRELSRTVSSASRFNGYNIIPLMEQFRVSKEAMAIRLEQLNLVSL